MVVIFGTSANPPTGFGGHAGVVSWLASQPLTVHAPRGTSESPAELQLRADEVWVLPVFQHAYAEKRDLAPYVHRRRMAELAFEHLPGLEGRVRVKDTERDVAAGQPVSRVASAFQGAGASHMAFGGPRTGTIDVWRHLERQSPDTQLVLALGADAYGDLDAGRWKESEALLRSAPIAVIARAGLTDPPEPCIRVPGLSDISSSAVRRSTDRAWLGTVLQPEVLAYIGEQRLYAFGA